MRIRLPPSRPGGAPDLLQSLGFQSRISSTSPSTFDPVDHVDRLDDTTGRLVQAMLRRALEMRRQIARDGWWN
jgi:hypothetical protein